MEVLSSFVPTHPDLVKILPHLQELVDKQPRAKLASVEDVAIDPLENGKMVRMVGAAAYAETGDDHWFIQWVVRENPEGTRLHVQGAVPMGLNEGEVVVFDASQKHWVQTSSDGTQKYHATVLIGTGVSERPDREQAQETLLGYLREHFPKVTEEALARRAPRP